MLRDPSLIPLSRQHQHGLALCVLTRRALSADSSPQNLARLAQRVIHHYEVELVNHFQIEEQVLFPASGPMPLIGRLLAEHRQIDALVARLRAESSAALLDEFCTLLSTHIRTEENQLFEQIQHDLPRAILDDAGIEIERRVVRVCL
jgi:hemerythrin-like domain-containing protein